MKIFIRVLLLWIACSSCDYHIEQYGYVLDSQTEERIKDYRVTLNSGALEVDSSGFFRKEGLTGRYKSKLLSVEKQGYKPFIVDIDRLGDDVATYRVNQKYRTVQSAQDRVTDSTTYRIVQAERVNDYSSKFTVSGDTIWIYLEAMQDN
jgi:hypothetical protein